MTMSLSGLLKLGLLLGSVSGLIACGDKSEKSDTKAAKGRIVTSEVTSPKASDGTFYDHIVAGEQNADGTLSNKKNADIWADPNQQEFFQICSPGQKQTAVDEYGRSWGFEGGASCRFEQ